MRILQAGKNYQSSEKMKKSYHLAKRQVNGSFPSRASFMDMGPEQQNRKPHSEGPALSLMLCCHHLEILNNSLTRGPMSSFWMGPHKVQFLTTWLPLGCPRFPWVPAKDWSVSQCQPTQSILGFRMGDSAATLSSQTNTQVPFVLWVSLLTIIRKTELSKGQFQRLHSYLASQ